MVEACALFKREDQPYFNNVLVWIIDMNSFIVYPSKSEFVWEMILNQEFTRKILISKSRFFFKHSALLIMITYEFKEVE